MKDFGFAVCSHGGEERGAESGDAHGEVLRELGSLEGGGVLTHHVKVHQVVHGVELGHGAERFLGKDGEHLHCAHPAKKADGGGPVDCDIIGGFDLGREPARDGGVAEVKHEHVVQLHKQRGGDDLLLDSLGIRDKVAHRSKTRRTALRLGEQDKREQAHLGSHRELLGHLKTTDARLGAVARHNGDAREASDHLRECESVQRRLGLRPRDVHEGDHGR